MNNHETKAQVFARFWKSVSKTDGCWLWAGRRDRQGYGEFKGFKKRFKAHGFAYRFTVGEVPHGLELDHTCRQRHCVNPAHLEPVTHRENILRGNTIMAENARKTHCKRGHPLSGENLRINPSGSRQCKACDAMRSRKYSRLAALRKGAE